MTQVQVESTRVPGERVMMLNLVVFASLIHASHIASSSAQSITVPRPEGMSAAYVLFTSDTRWEGQRGLIL